MTSRDIINKLSGLFEEIFELTPEVIPLTGGGSPRQYFRLKNGNISVIGVGSVDIKENEDFLRLDKYLDNSGIKVPHIIITSHDTSCYLLQDLGDILLLNLLERGDRIKWSQKALSALIKFQTLPEKMWIDKVGYPPFSERLVKWDLNYFKYDFLKPVGLLFDEEKLEDDFERLTSALTGKNLTTGLMYRDFQSRNIMVWHDELWMIDFQGARKGPMVYDAVSFIWQAKAPFSYSEREELGDFYITELEKRGFDRDNLKIQMEVMQLFRTLQVLGAYGFRGLIERKSHFLDSLPYAISNLMYLKDQGIMKDYPELEKITDILSKLDFGKEKENDGLLTVKVFSFSYKKGYPEDKSGNGGGFVFDCRAIHNPGRYEEYKTLTGLNEEVIRFLEQGDEARIFVERAVEIVTPSIERYIKRGFTSLQIGFGCTGGRHRSVYCAERFAGIIKEKFPQVSVKIIHREQNIIKE